MCGIIGAFNLKQPPLREDVKKQIELLNHRGPDDLGIWINHNSYLAIKRLSIIDVLHGKQPVFARSESIIAVFNGEIYNYRELQTELREKGIVLKSNSDAEVIPHLYSIFGENFVEKLDGMFAIAIIDEKEKKIVLYRDRLGEKPLWYGVRDGAIFFASELKALESIELAKDINFKNIEEFLKFGYFTPSLSPYEGVFQLKPGSKLRYQEGEISITEYWSPRNYKFEQENLSFGDALDTLDELLESSVKLRLNSERPVGVFLSGGIDSSLIAFYASKLSGNPISTFSLGFESIKYSEISHARRVASKLNTNHFEQTIRLSEAEDFDDIMSKSDLPFGDSSFIATYYLSKFAAENFIVLLSGDGGDEAFAGYDRFRITQQISKFENLIPKVDMSNFIAFRDRRRQKLIRSFTATNFSNRYLQTCYVIPPKLLEKMFNRDYSQVRKDLPYQDSASIHVMNDLRDLQIWDIENYLPGDLLYKVDTASMSNSIEVRSPFLDHKILEFGLSLPREFKVGFGKNKRILRELAYRHLSSEIMDRPKQGFAIPKAEWLREGLRERCAELLLTQDAWIHSILDAAKLRKLYERHQSGWDLGEMLWTLMTLEHWARRRKLS